MTTREGGSARFKKKSMTARKAGFLLKTKSQNNGLSSGNQWEMLAMVA